METIKKYKVLIIILVTVILLTIFALYQNNTIVITKIDYVNDKIPMDFDGLKIAHISDLHNKRFGKEQKKLVKKLQSTNPNIIVITGDLIDRRIYNLEVALDFVKKAVLIAPVYYVPGNHEASSGEFINISNELSSLGVIVLENSMLDIEKGNSTVIIAGIKDPIFLKSDNVTENHDFLNEVMAVDGFKILLSHRPELFEEYVKYDMDLVFTGHAHGGQVKIPFIGPIYAPQQGFFPKYVSGSYTDGNTTMIVSRGLGNSLLPFRLNNKPEIVVVTLKSN